MNMKYMILGLALFQAIDAMPPKYTPVSSAVADAPESGDESDTTELVSNPSQPSTPQSFLLAPPPGISWQPPLSIAHALAIPIENKELTDQLTKEHNLLANSGLALQLCQDYINNQRCKNAPVTLRASLIAMILEITQKKHHCNINIISFGAGKLLTEFLLAEQLIIQGAESVTLYVVDPIYAGETTISANTKGLILPLGMACTFSNFTFVAGTEQTDPTITQRIHDLDDKVHVIAYANAQSLIASLSAEQWSAINFLLWIDGGTRNISERNPFLMLKNKMPFDSRVCTLADSSIKCSLIEAVCESDNESSTSENSSEYSSEE